ncbi:MAG: S1 RNA-binding domain-containing protein, partial [Acidobacteria bacterium]|nr:S1 RNA-binding domain-containing protein [Acidobacteriota bacterium]
MSDETKPEASGVPPTDEAVPGAKDSATTSEASAQAEDGQPVVETSAKTAETDAGESSSKTAGAEEKAAELKARQARVAPLYRAFRGKRGINGRVEKTIKGGYEIRIGKARAFCPHSQIDVQRVDDPESWVGTTHLFQITQLRRGGDDVVVSRRAVIEAERREEASAVRATLIDGAVMLGRVSGLAKFGAFVDLGAGVNGLVHITELSHGRINRVDQAVHVGEPVRVKILKLHDDSDRISLSIRQASEDPWASVTETYEVGGVYAGKVLRLADFGAFIEIAPGIEALAHVSTFPPTGKADGWKASVSPGSEVAVEILTIDSERKRMGVAVVEEGSVRAESAHAQAPQNIEVGAQLVGKVERHESYGVFVFLKPGTRGLLPVEETGLDRGQDLRKAFPVGSDVEVI